jgi:hypothetical protein
VLAQLNMLMPQLAVVVALRVILLVEALVAYYLQLAHRRLVVIPSQDPTVLPQQHFLPVVAVAAVALEAARLKRLVMESKAVAVVAVLHIQA